MAFKILHNPSRLVRDFISQKRAYNLNLLINKNKLDVRTFIYSLLRKLRSILPLDLQVEITILQQQLPYEMSLILNFSPNGEYP